MTGEMAAKALKPIKRSWLRRLGGRVYYTCRRWYDWYLKGKRYARLRDAGAGFPHLWYSHSSPLLRSLPGLQMQWQRNKIVNLKLAAAALDGLILRPGEVFSFWRLVGRPTRRKGYLPGMTLDHGRMREGMGGGLCQLTNLIYWLTLHTPLLVLERWRHSYDVFPDAGRELPFGSGATCAYPYLDLQIRNTGKEPVQLRLWLTAEHLLGEWRGKAPLAFNYEVYESEHCITQEPWGGYMRHNVLRRRILRPDGGCEADEPVTENHALMMYQPFLTEGGEKGKGEREK